MIKNHSHLESIQRVHVAKAPFSTKVSLSLMSPSRISRGEAFLLRWLPKPQAHGVLKRHRCAASLTPVNKSKLLSLSLLCRLKRFRPLNKASIWHFVDFRCAIYFFANPLAFFCHWQGVFDLKRNKMYHFLSHNWIKSNADFQGKYHTGYQILAFFSPLGNSL